ncbi:hypothetical protein FOBRF1_005199 [Fusarium oxysporum]
MSIEIFPITSFSDGCALPIRAHIRSIPFVHSVAPRRVFLQQPPQQQLIHLHVLATTDNMIEGSSTPSNMGRGAYDTTGCPKPPPRPRPS